MQILTWNVQWCCGLDGLADPARILRHALAMGEGAGGIDVLCLQEIAVNYRGLAGAPVDQVAQVQSALPAGWQVSRVQTTHSGCVSITVTLFSPLGRRGEITRLHCPVSQ